ncbi:MAG TPA: arsenate reductase ArsC [Alphaproteobacteria bacterium]|nr:phosphotyrosine protein phosphatase [Rhodospirillaceae bacterium]HRJ66259.1 arsenate reductase ArsC [Alphaproteobacteria bacterium]
MSHPIEVLILCTGNSCRSVMAEALLNHLGQGRFKAYSAGSKPAGHVHAGALATLKRHGIPAGTPASKSWDVFAHQPLDIVVTVCDSAAAESCPVFLGTSGQKPRKLHWPTPDPAHAAGSPDEIVEAFDTAFFMLKTRIEHLIAETPAV